MCLTSCTLKFRRKPVAHHQNNHTLALSSSSSFLFNIKKKASRHQRGQRSCESTTSDWEKRQRGGKKVNDGWRWWWKMNTHSCQNHLPSSLDFPAFFPFSFSPSSSFFFLFCSAWGASSGSALTCHESTVIPPLQDLPMCVFVCVC